MPDHGLCTAFPAALDRLFQMLPGLLDTFFRVDHIGDRNKSSQNYDQAISRHLHLTTPEGLMESAGPAILLSSTFSLPNNSSCVIACCRSPYRDRQLDVFRSHQSVSSGS